MTPKPLQNLVKTRQIKAEPPDQAEFNNLLFIEGLSVQGQFSMAYHAAHAMALAALRWHGYRSDSRYLVFQCLQHTVGFEAVKWRVLDTCHKQRNLAEYEGHLDVPPQLLRELLEISGELLHKVESLGPVSTV